jgi:hypothetical protein
MNSFWTFVLVLLIVSANLAVSARVERTLDIDVLSCRLTNAIMNSSLECLPGLPSQHDSEHVIPIPGDHTTKMLVTSLTGGLSTMIAIYIAGGLSRYMEFIIGDA